MRIYGEHQSGGSLTCLSPGDKLTLFDGSENPAAGLTSLAFARGPSPSGSDAGVTFQIIGALAGIVGKVQASNVDVEADYQDIWTTTGPLASDNYTDTARWAFYRYKFTAVGAAIAVPSVRVQR